MALQSLNLPIYWPGICNHGSSTPALSSVDTLDASAEYSCTVLCASRDMVVSHVGLKPGAATGSPTGEIRIETIDAATGAPTGTLWGTNTSVTTATLTTSFALHALTASATITKGQVFGVKFVYATGTSYVLGTLPGTFPNKGLPYSITNTSGSAVKTPAATRNAVLGSSTTAFYAQNPFYPAASIAANAFNNTNSARRGVRFQVPFKCRAVGGKFFPAAGTGNFNAALFDDAGAELSSSSTAFEGNATSILTTCLVDLYFDNPVTLSPATWYRFAIEPSSATNVNMYTATLPGADYRAAWPGGTNFHYTTYTASTWVDTATDQVPFMDILVDQLDDGINAASGGGYVIGS